MLISLVLTAALAQTPTTVTIAQYAKYADVAGGFKCGTEVIDPCTLVGLRTEVTNLKPQGTTTKPRDSVTPAPPKTDGSAKPPGTTKPPAPKAPSPLDAWYKEHEGDFEDLELRISYVEYLIGQEDVDSPNNTTILQNIELLWQDIDALKEDRARVDELERWRREEVDPFIKAHKAETFVGSPKLGTGIGFGSVSQRAIPEATAPTMMYADLHAALRVDLGDGGFTTVYGGLFKGTHATTGGFGGVTSGAEIGNTVDLGAGTEIYQYEVSGTRHNPYKRATYYGIRSSLSLAFTVSDDLVITAWGGVSLLHGRADFPTGSNRDWAPAAGISFTSYIVDFGQTKEERRAPKPAKSGKAGSGSAGEDQTVTQAKVAETPPETPPVAPPAAEEPVPTVNPEPPGLRVQPPPPILDIVPIEVERREQEGVKPGTPDPRAK